MDLFRVDYILVLLWVLGCLICIRKPSKKTPLIREIPVAVAEQRQHQSPSPSAGVFNQTHSNPYQLVHFGELNGGKLLQPKIDGAFFMKPEGDNLLWTSPINSTYGWVDWAPNMEGILDGQQVWLIDLKPSANILRIHTRQDFINLIERFPAKENVKTPLDWKILAENCDALWVTTDSPLDPYWDCESVVIFNTDCVEKVTATGRMPITAVLDPTPLSGSRENQFLITFVNTLKERRRSRIPTTALLSDSIPHA